MPLKVCTGLAVCVNVGETRRIIRVGPKSYALILPKRWLQEMGLGAGDSLVISPCNDQLVVRALSSRSPSRPIVRLSYSEASKAGLDVESVIACSFLMGFERVEVDGVDREELSSAGNSYTPWIEVEDSTVSFTVKESAYDEKLLLKHMLRDTAILVDSILGFLSGREDLDKPINDVLSDTRKYGHLLARRLISTNNVENTNIPPVMAFSTGLIMGLIGELLLVTAITLKKKPLDPESATIVSRLLVNLKEAIQEALSSLIYGSSKRCRRAKNSLEKLRRKLRMLRLYSSLHPDAVDHVSRIDAMMRLTGKLVESCQCMCLAKSSQPGSRVEEGRSL